MTRNTQYYFDYAAATPLSPVVLKAMEPFFNEQFYNPSALYLASQTVKKAIATARADSAKVLGAKPGEIIFTAGGTEANNLAIQGIMRQYDDANMIVSSIEHESVLAPAGLFKSKLLDVGPDGLIDLKKLNQLIDDQTVLVSIMYANNEIGTIQPLKEVAKLIKRTREDRVKRGNKLPLYLHSDACQASNYLHILVDTLGVDLLTVNAAKIYGPKQCGLLFVKGGVKLEPVIYGGGQEGGMRSGTENAAAIVGFATALKETAGLRDTESARLKQLQTLALDFLQKNLPGVSVNGSLSQRLPNNLHITIPGHDNERLLMALDEQGYMVAAGSACSASSDEPSHVLKAIGLSDELARSSLRITMGRQTTKTELVGLLKTLTALI